ncbi:MAG TPA: T9SS type A sorting domain-containing protein [Bacteroidia bacterium]|nr:T9SS type A sorting domain-containing protein [Bacteroidia bacterium]
MKSTATIVIYLLSLYSFNFCHAQRANVWHFGNQAGLDFNSGSPVEILNNPMYSLEGTASICDLSGNILMYTNGGVLAIGTNKGAIWNSQDSIMPNGDLDSASGCYSSAQSSLIVPDPGNSNQYYVFTTDCQEHGMAGGLRFNLVDMTLDNGLGDVVVKDSLLISSVNESIAGIRHANGTDYWVVVHGVGTMDFYSFHISAAGISAPVVSSTGNWAFQSSGQLAANCSGDKLVYAAYQTMLFDFDNNTGIISNYIDLGFDAFGCAFSPSGRYLYMSSLGFTSEIKQFDLYAANIPASAQLVGQTSLHNIGNIALGPDHKIYISRSGAYYLGTINNPELAGAACGYVGNSVTLTRESQYGLPNFVNTFTGECTMTGIVQNVNTHESLIVYNKDEKLIHIYFNKIKPVTIEVRDVTGRTIISENVTGGSETIVNVSSISKGIYTVDISGKDKNISGKKIFIY